MLKDFDEEKFNELTNALGPLEMVSRKLCLRDINLNVADNYFTFAITKLRSQRSQIADQLCDAIIHRVSERREIQSDAIHYLLFRQLPDGGNCFFEISSKRRLVNFFHELLVRLTDSKDEEPVDEETSDEDEMDNGRHFDSLPRKRAKLEMEDELNQFLKKRNKILEREVENPALNPNSLKHTIKLEMDIFEKGNKLGNHLQLILDFLKTIKPTSVESERVFSSSGYLCNKLRTRLNSDTLCNLSYLRSYLQQRK